MCYNCGCANPQDDMGNADNITRLTLQQLSEKLNKPLQEIKLQVFDYLQNKKKDNPELEEMFSKASKAWGQSAEEAKSNTLKLLQDELKK